MKKTLFIITVLAVILQSCSTLYYQVYEVETDVNRMEDVLVYSDENCDVIYNLWADGGDVTFVLSNKTEKDIIIDLRRSFVIKNGMAYNYYDNNTYTSTESVYRSATESIMKAYGAYINVSKTEKESTSLLWTPATVGAAASATVAKTTGVSTSRAYSSSVTKNPVEYIIVPARAAKVVKSYNVSDYVHLECDNYKFSFPEKISEKIVYTEQTTPMKFRNRIIYIMDNAEYSIDNTFWIRSLQNYAKKKMIDESLERDCFSWGGSIVSTFKIWGPNMFYNAYGGSNSESWY